MKTKPHWSVIFHYTCTLSSPFFPFTSTFSLLSFALVYRHRSNLMGLVLFLRRIRCCYSFFSLSNHWVSYVSALPFGLFSFLELTVIVNLLLGTWCWHKKNSLELDFSISWCVCVFYFVFLVLLVSLAWVPGSVGLCILVLYFVCMLISGLLFFCWDSCWGVFFLIVIPISLLSSSNCLHFCVTFQALRSSDYCFGFLE